MQDYELACDAIRRHSPLQPLIGIVLGTGFGDIAQELRDATVIGYADIPGFPVSTAPGHKGHLHLGMWGGCPVVVMQGRVHAYEGYSPQTVGFPIQVMYILGVRTVFLVNSAGGINSEFGVADIMFIHDHISLASLAGQDPMRGPNIDSFGSRFTPLNGAYDRTLLRMASDVAKENRITAHQGVYGYVVGPSFETASEVRLLATLGVDAVGMSTVPEVITARHAGMAVFAVSGITNRSIGDIDSTRVTTEDEVWQSVETIVPDLTLLLREMVRRACPDHK